MPELEINGKTWPNCVVVNFPEVCNFEGKQFQVKIPFDAERPSNEEILGDALECAAAVHEKVPRHHYDSVRWDLRRVDDSSYLAVKRRRRRTSKMKG